MAEKPSNVTVGPESLLDPTVIIGYLIIATLALAGFLAGNRIREQ